MLIYSEQRLVPTDVNMLVLRGDAEGFYYIHRALYDQAVIINDIYKDCPERLVEAITGQTETRPDVDYFMENAPSPISILGPFLLLVKQELTEFVDMVGAIHVMSGPINLRNMLRYPVEMRNTPTFSLTIKEEYELAWDRFFKTTMPFGEQVYQPQMTTVAPMNGTATTTVPTEPEEVLTNVGASGQVYEDPLEALLFDCGDDIFDMPKKDTEEEKPTAPVTPAPSPAPIAPAPEPVKEPEPEQPVKKPKNGLDILRSGGM